MTIYFVAETESVGRNGSSPGRSNRAVKIGYTEAAYATKRLTDLQMGNPRRLKLLAEVDGDDRDERRLHEIFKHQRLAGEWFLLPPEFIKALGRKPFSIDELMEDLGGTYVERWDYYKPPTPMSQAERGARAAWDAMRQEERDELAAQSIVRAELRASARAGGAS